MTAADAAVGPLGLVLARWLPRARCDCATAGTEHISRNARIFAAKFMLFMRMNCRNCRATRRAHSLELIQTAVLGIIAE